ncbi:MAG: hypothetical protein HQM10_21085 [Candidatus Riflebacteria bacterium]|nr:hypothetical protein [Candidatus Riflebacteria bacterium]
MNKLFKKKGIMLMELLFGAILLGIVSIFIYTHLTTAWFSAEQNISAMKSNITANNFFEAMIATTTEKKVLLESLFPAQDISTWTVIPDNSTYSSGISVFHPPYFRYVDASTPFELADSFGNRVNVESWLATSTTEIPVGEWTVLPPPTVEGGAPFTPHFDHTTTVFGGYLWIFAGNPDGNTATNSSYRSLDGVNWEPVAPMSIAREGHTTAVINDTIYVIGGAEEDRSDNYSTFSYNSDGTWDDVYKPYGNSVKLVPYNLSTVVFNNVVIMIAGLNLFNNTLITDTWWTSNPNVKPWNHTATNLPPRYSHASAVFSNKIWTIGGRNLTTFLGDVWSSSDGFVWNQVLSSGPFGAREEFSLVAHETKLYLLGGHNATGYLDDVWSSTDGINWVLESGNLSYPVAAASAEVFNDMIYLVAGKNDTGALSKIQVFIPSD